MRTNFKVIGLTGFGMKPKSAAPEADAFTTRPFELFAVLVMYIILYHSLVEYQAHH